MARNRKPSAKRLAWEQAVKHHRAMVDRYEAMHYPVQGENWKVNTIYYHNQQIAALEAAEPPKYEDS